MSDHIDIQPIDIPKKEDTDYLSILPKALVGTILDSLEDKLPTLNEIALKHEIGFDVLTDVLDELETETNFDTDIFYSNLDELVHEDAEQKLKTAKIQATNAISQRGGIAIIDKQTESSQNVSIPKCVRPMFKSGIENITIQKTESFRFDFNNPKEAHDFFDDIFTNLFIKVADLRKLIPSLDDIYERKISDIELNIVKSELHGTKFVINAVKDSSTIKLIKRKSRELNELLKEFVDNPEKTASKWFYKTNKKIIEELIQVQVNLHVAESLTEVYSNIDKSLLKKEKSKPKTIEQQSKKRKNQPREIALEPTTELNTTQKVEDQHASKTTEALVSLSWVNDGKPTPQTVETIFINNKGVNIVYVIDPKLINIADATLQKTDVSNKIQNAIQHQATALANGIYPWDTNSNVKRVSKRKRQTPPEFQNETIYYTYDLRPNAPRVYFIIKPTSELLHHEQSNQELLSQKNPCMVILAITDKQNQIEVLQRLTGKQHKDLRSKGTGSI